MNSTRFILLLICIATFAACKKAAAPSSATEDRKNYSHAATDDAAMNGAIVTAQKTSADFLKALRNPKSSYSDFGVKKPYPIKDGGQEHMWISEVREAGDHLEGIIANDAYETTEVKLGDAVKFKLGEISDWKYLDDNKLVGGYTIRYFYDRLNPKEKEDFVKESGFTVD